MLIFLLKIIDAHYIIKSYNHYLKNKCTKKITKPFINKRIKKGFLHLFYKQKWKKSVKTRI